LRGWNCSADNCFYAGQMVSRESWQGRGRRGAFGAFCAAVFCEAGMQVMMSARKLNARQEYRLKQRERIDGSPLIAKKFPRLKGLRVTLMYYDTKGVTKNGEMKCKMNVEHARSELWFSCSAGDCLAGDFNLSAALASAVAGRHKVAAGEIRCQGARKRGDRERVPCQALLRYRLNLDYD